MKGTAKSTAFLWFLILLGAVAGSLVGDAIGNSLSIFGFLKNSYQIGTKAPLVLNLKILTVTIGMNFNINIMTIVGVVMSIILYRRY